MQQNRSNNKQKESGVPPVKKNRNSRNRKRNQNKKSGDEKSAFKNYQDQSKSFSEKQNRNYRARKFSKNTSKNDADEVLRKWLNVREQYINARKKYYELFSLADNKQRIRLEKVYQTALKSLRDFEQRNQTNSNLKKNFEKVSYTYPEEKGYIQTHPEAEDSIGNTVTLDENFDPHLKEGQMSDLYINDFDESLGSIEDYKNYKESK